MIQVTNAQGDPVPRLLYWMPGAILPGTVNVTAKATAPCASCSGGQEESRKRTKAVKITPHEI